MRLLQTMRSRRARDRGNYVINVGLSVAPGKASPFGSEQHKKKPDPHNIATPFCAKRVRVPQHTPYVRSGRLETGTPP